MNGVVSLGRQARQLYLEVLNEKDIAIRELSKQVQAYQGEIIAMTERVQDIGKEQSMEQHSVEDLLRAGFVRKEDIAHHILIDVSNLVRDKAFLKLDCRVEIVREVSSSENSYQQLNELYNQLNEENNRLKNQIELTDREKELIISSLTAQIEVNRGQPQERIKELQGKIGELEEKVEILQDENQMMEIEAKQKQADRNDSFKDKYELIKREMEEKEQLTSQSKLAFEQLRQANEQISQENQSIKAQIFQLKENVKELDQHISNLSKKNQQLSYQNRKLVLQEGVPQIEQFHSQSKSQQSEDIYWRQKCKALQVLQVELKQQNHKMCQTISKLTQQLLDKDTHLQQLNSKQKESSKPKQENYHSEIIQILSSRINNEPENVIFSPPEKDITFPQANTPKEKEQSKQKAKTKKLIRVGY